MAVAGFARELADEAARAQLVPRLLSDAPEEWRLGRLTVVVDRARGTALVRYARAPVARCQAAAEAVMAAWRRALARLERGSLAPDQLWPALAAVYDTLAPDPGARIRLVDAAAELARGLGRPYPRSQLSWDIARLLRERRLEHSDGRRLDLGVATGGAALRRRQVLWIEDESGRGQYYVDLRMLSA